MSTASRPFSALPSPVKRLIAWVGACAFFLTVSAILNPDRTLADAKAIVAKDDVGNALRRGEIELPAPKESTKHPLLGQLVGSPYHIWVYAGASGPVYTVADKQGKILVTEVSAEELYEQVPGASVENLRLLPSGTNIMVVPDKHD